jgi:hypothetical protein
MNDNLTDFILDKLAAAPEGRLSVSYLTDEIRGPMPGTRRCYGPFPHFPAGHSDAMDAFQKLGFKVVHGKRRYTWDVTL